MSSEVFSQLLISKIGRRQYRIETDFQYTDKVFGPITVMFGFVTNFASIDKLRNGFLFVLYALLVGYGDQASTIHDWLYSGYGIKQEDGSVYYPTRKECDEIFKRALREEGVARWRCWLFYYGVRLFGGREFRRIRGVFPATA